jgi:hypothetical protein
VPPTASTLQLERLEEDDILQEHLTRNVQFFGLEKQKRIGGAFVVVIGLGVRVPAAATCPMTHSSLTYTPYDLVVGRGKPCCPPAATVRRRWPPAG